jgi:hypothetical protein
LNLGAAAKPHVVNRYTITLAASELVRYTPLRDGAEEPNTISDHKLLSGLFLPDSKAALTRMGKIQCRKVYSLVFTP